MFNFNSFIRYAMNRTLYSMFRKHFFLIAVIFIGGGYFASQQGMNLGDALTVSKVYLLKGMDYIGLSGVMDFFKL